MDVEQEPSGKFAVEVDPVRSAGGLPRDPDIFHCLVKDYTFLCKCINIWCKNVGLGNGFQLCVVLIDSKVNSQVINNCKVKLVIH